MSDVANFRKALADKKNDSRLWTPQDALEDTLERIKSGEIDPSQIVIHYLSDNPDGTCRHGFTCAGVTYPQHIALLAVAHRRVLDDWVC